MRIVALEEHFAVSALEARIPRDAIAARGLTPGEHPVASIARGAALRDVGRDRLADMDMAGITMQVLSLAGAGADLVCGAAGAALARDSNDFLAQIIADHPDRYAGFAHLPTADPGAAADELARCVTGLGFRGGMVNGTTGGLFLDHPSFEPLLAQFERLDVPLYLHPAPPPEPVRQAYYDALPGASGYLLGIAGWGWHSETAIHVLRLVLSGTLDRHPRLKIIIGHMGEGLPAMMARMDLVFAGEVGRLSRSVSSTITDHVWVTTSGLFTAAPFLSLLLTFGIDRIMFAVDYPFSSNARGRAFLDGLQLSPSDKAKLAHGNADALLRLD